MLKKILSIKNSVFFILLSFICGFSTQVFAADSYNISAAEQAQMMEQVAKYQQMVKTYYEVQQEIAAKQAAGEFVDWNSVADKMGMPRSTPDDIADRMKQLQDMFGNDLNALYGDTKDRTWQEYWDWHWDVTKAEIANGTIHCQGSNARSSQECIDKFFDNYLPGSKIINKPTQIPKDSNMDNAPGSFFDVSYMLSQIQAQIPALIRLVVAIAYLTGMIMIVIGIGKLKAYGHQTVMSSSHASFTPSLVYFLIGTILMFFPTMVNVGTNSVMTGGGDVAYSYNISTAGFGYANLFSAIISIIHLVGYIAFLRGWLMLVRLGNHAQAGTLSKGLVHIIGGIMAINIISTWEVIKVSFGFIW